MSSEVEKGKYPQFILWDVSTVKIPKLSSKFPKCLLQATYKQYIKIHVLK